MLILCDRLIFNNTYMIRASHRKQPSIHVRVFRDDVTVLQLRYYPLHTCLFLNLGQSKWSLVENINYTSRDEKIYQANPKITLSNSLQKERNLKIGIVSVLIRTTINITAKITTWSHKVGTDFDLEQSSGQTNSRMVKVSSGGCAQ